jgi:hypothetical protein
MTSDDVTLAELARGQLRIETKLDRVTMDHEIRLRRLERAVWVATGLGAAALTSGVGALLQGLLG